MALRLLLIVTYYIISIYSLLHSSIKMYKSSSFYPQHITSQQHLIKPRSMFIRMVSKTPLMMSSSSQYRSFYQMNKKSAGEVLIEAPTMNSRTITAGILIDASPDDIWAILTDYNNLATHVPNLVQSYLVPSSDKNTIRLFQEGAQKIIGFDFRASLTMDMREDDGSDGDDSGANKPKKLFFRLVDSSMFSSFDGEWIVRTHSRRKELDASSGQLVFRYKTLLIYTVLVRPRGPVPVIALEWRIKEDVPINLEAMKIAAEKRANAVTVVGNIVSSALAEEEEDENELRAAQAEWDMSETLGVYIE